MTGNEEFDLGLTDVPNAVKAKGKKKADEVDVVISETKPKSEQKVRIMIDEVAGLSNYEVVGVNGTVYQIKRGVPVDVPYEVVHALENAQMTIIEQRKNPLTGLTEEVPRTFSAVPWRRA